MGLFDIFKKTPMVRCAQCGVQIKETDAHRHQGKVFCTICFSHQDFSSGPKSNVTFDIPNLTQQINTAKKDLDSKAMPAMIQDIKKHFDTVGIKCLSAQFGDQWEVHAGVNGKDTSYTIKYITKGTDGGDLGLRIFSLIHVPDGKRREALATLSGLQSRYRFWRLNLDDGNNVNVEYDFPPATSNHGKMAAELFLRTVKLIDDIYPELAKCVWN